MLSKHWYLVAHETLKKGHELGSNDTEPMGDLCHSWAEVEKVK